MHDEDTIVQRAKKNDPNAFAELYEEYFDKIFRYIAVKTGNREDAEDMTQQVFLKAHKSISSYRFQGVPFSAWLYRIAHNLIVDYYRKSSKKPDTLSDDIQISDKGERNPEQLVERRMEIRRVVEAAQNLTEAQREVISLRFAGELPTMQVAEIMGKSQGAVKALQHSAIVSLRRALLADNDEQGYRV